MPPGGDKEGTHSNGHNSTTVGPIEQTLTVLKSSDTALQKRSAAKQQQTPAMSSNQRKRLRHLGDCWL